MLVQDTLTGALHEVPDVAGYAGYDGYAAAPGYDYYADPPELGYYGDQPETVMGEVYDGFGNPVGFLPFLAPLASALASKALPMVSKLIPGIAKAIPGVSQIMGGLLPGAAPPATLPPAMAAIGAQLPMQQPMLNAMQNPMMQSPMGAVPPGWMHPQPGYQPHAHMHRRYMRCVSWPGPPGLVPTNAGAPMQPPATVVAAAQFPIRRRLQRRRR